MNVILPRGCISEVFVNGYREFKLYYWEVVRKWKSKDIHDSSVCFYEKERNRNCLKVRGNECVMLSKESAMCDRSVMNEFCNMMEGTICLEFFYVHSHGGSRQGVVHISNK